ncbi:MAG: hypothetical protein ACYC1D_17245 [Acidimicrobiales bacterium]
MRFRLIAPDGSVIDEGEAEVEVERGALVLSPALGAPIEARTSDIVSVSEPAPYLLCVTLRDASRLELSQLGRLRTQITDQLASARADHAHSDMLLVGIGTPEAFEGAVGDAEAELRLYDDALVGLPASGEAVQVPYSLVASVCTDRSGYVVLVQTIGGEQLSFRRLGRRTSEFVSILQERLIAERKRTSAFLAALLPGLSTVALRRAAALLQDGVAATKSDLDDLDASLWPALQEAVVADERKAHLDMLQSAGAVSIGFKQRVSVEHGPKGTTAWQDPSVNPSFDHGGTPTMPGGLAGMIGGGVLAGMGQSMGHGGFAGGFVTRGGFGGYERGYGVDMAFAALGRRAVFGASGAHQERPSNRRADVERARATAASTDYEALSAEPVTHEGEPTVLAFALATPGTGAIVFEPLNLGPEAPSHVFRGRPEELSAVQAALFLIDFRVEALSSAGASAVSPYQSAVVRSPFLALLRSRWLGEARLGRTWEEDLGKLLRSAVL